VEGNIVWIESFTALQNNQLFVRMAGSAGTTYTGGLEDELRVPDDAISYIVEYVLRVFGQPAPQDTSNDGVNQK
jgi:hypothetical protein